MTNIIRKEIDGSIKINAKLEKNGDYYIIHAYDESLRNSINKQNKLNQITTWLNTTFKYNIPEQDNTIASKVAQIYKSDMKHNLIDIINWLNN